jgi:4'-phosphopantetheinyl transferase
LPEKPAALGALGGEGLVRRPRRRLNFGVDKLCAPLTKATAVALIPLADDEVHAWHILPERIARPDLLQRRQEFLSDEERARWRRFVREIDAHHYLIAHALLRTALSQYVDTAPGAWRFECNEFGRPYVAEPKIGRDLQFNLSHAQGLVACAVTWRRPVGIDVENFERTGVGVELAANYFSPYEIAALRSLPAAAQPERFLEYWTLKEAYLKARGVGLSLPLDCFSIDLRPEPPIGISFAASLDDDPAAWQFAQFRPTPRHVLAVAVRRPPGEDLRISLQGFTLDETPAAD